MNKIKKTNKEYSAWIKELKTKIRSVQIKAALQVNAELLAFYWELGAGIIEKQAATSWGDGFLVQLSKDLASEFPDMKGFSRRNLELIRQWYVFWATRGTSQFAKQPVSQLLQIPWGHNIAIIAKCKNRDEALYYAKQTMQHSWSRAILAHQIESRLFEREGKAITNFRNTLPAPQSDLAQQTIKDPYCFDFLVLREKHDEKELEDGLLNHVTRFLLELGAGFSFIARQYRLEIEGDEFFIDLLFYHARLHCYVVVELKTVSFKPEFAGKLNFYVSAVDGMLKTDVDNPTVGMLICKSRNKTVVEYALKDIHKPIGVSQYAITKNLPKEFKSSLPSIEEIEAELEGGDE